MLKMSRLPGRSIREFGWSIKRHQLWLSTEYLLYRELSPFGEKVNRYYHGDIQAIISGPTRSWGRANIVMGSLLALFAALIAYLIVADAPTPLIAFPAIGAGIVGLVLSGNLFLGPTCKTILYTATSEAPLYSLGRQRSAQKAIERILPFIEAAQGTDSPGTDSRTEP
ncbi:MAG: hypothetical protein L3K26_01890 [Candidatus Hydrogenedentes bacterium]|nr:hypothetical protein [Candidatus Hydrogenedentota bacterium]